MAPLEKKQRFWRSLSPKPGNKQRDSSRYLAISVALIYAVISILWIACSDRLLSVWALSVEDLTRLQTLKGWFFVSCTSLLLYGLIQRGVRQLRQKHQLLQNIINSTNDGIFVRDIRGHYLVINKTAAQALGVRPGDVLGKGAEQFFTAADAEQMRSLEATILRTGQPLEVEESLTINGELRWFATTKSLCLDERSRPIGIVSIARDITQRKQAEEELRRSEQLRGELKLLENILEIVLAGYWDWDIPGERSYLSPTYKRMLGYEDHELSNTPETWQQLIFPEDLPGVLNRFHQHVTSHGQTPYYNEVRYRHRDGSTVWVICSGRVIEWGADGSPLRAIGCHIDITARKHAEEHLQLVNAELARAAQLKDEFLANMSHELRTPLNAILGMSDVLQEEIYGTLNEKQHRCIEVLFESGNHLLNLINEILDLAKIESGKMTLQISSISIMTLCKVSLDFVKQTAQQKDIDLKTHIPTNLGEIDVDEHRMRQVLINLLSNAIKFTPSGGQVSLEVKHDRVQQTIQFSVIDTGIGIASENMPKLFQSFVQIDSKLNRQYNGTGLGLALVKRITELHQGTVTVTSKVGQGSCFTITLPYQGNYNSIQIQPTQSELDPRSQPSSDSDRGSSESAQPLILLAEDSQANIHTFSSYLMNYGFRLVVATNGQEAVDLAKQHQPDLILMDIQMPEVDGIEAARRIRADQALANIPIIALTALAMNGDREKCLAAGMTEYFSKPVSLKHLVNAIQQLLSVS